MKVEPVKFFDECGGMQLVAVCPRDIAEERNHVREVWIYPDGKPMSYFEAAQLLHHIRGPDIIDLRKADPRELVESAARWNWLVTEYLDDRDAHQVHFEFSVKQTSIGLVVAVIFWSSQDAPDLEGISLEASD